MKLIQDALDVFYSNGLLNIDALLCLQKVYYLEQHVSCLTLNCYDPEYLLCESIHLPWLVATICVQIRF